MHGKHWFGVGVFVALSAADALARAEPFLWLPFTEDFPITCGWTCTYDYGRRYDHRAIDYGTRTNTTIRAAADGVVHALLDGVPPGIPGAGRGYGNHVVIRHQNGYETRYAHLISRSITVRRGGRVFAGQIIGRSDNTGQSTGPHLHFEARDASGKRVNPYGDPPDYRNGCGRGALWATCPPQPAPEDADRDGFTVARGDCNDHDPDRHPDALESCNGVDDNCNGAVDEPWRIGLTTDIGNPCTIDWDTCRGVTSGAWDCAPDGLATICDALDPGGRHAAPEQCNAIDDDCDGGADEEGAEGALCMALANADTACVSGACRVAACRPGFADLDRTDANGCEYACVERALADGRATDAYAPVLLRVNGSVTALWADARIGRYDLYVGAYDRTLALFGGETLLPTSSADIAWPVAVVSGSTLAVTWQEHGGLALRTFDLRGVPLGAQANVSVSRSCCASAAATPAATALVYAYTSQFGWGGITFARVNSSGAVEWRSELARNARHAAIAPAGDAFAAAWAVDDHLMVQFLDRDGGPIAPAYDLGARATESEFALATAPPQAAVVWWQPFASVHALTLSAIDASGRRIPDVVTATIAPGAYPRRPAVAWSGNEWGIAWSDGGLARRGDIWFASLDPRGRAVTPPMRLSRHPDDDLDVALAVDVHGFVAGWRRGSTTTMIGSQGFLMRVCP